MTCVFPDVVARFIRCQTHYFKIRMCFLSMLGFSDVHKSMMHMHTNSPQNDYSQPCYQLELLRVQGVCTPSHSFSLFSFFFLFCRPFSILLTVAANWFCEEHSHTHQKQSSVMGFRQLSLTFYFCLLQGLENYQSTETNLKPVD